MRTTLCILAIAVFAQYAIGWPAALSLAAIAWIGCLGEDVVAGQMSKAIAVRSGCPYCAWGQPHRQGPGCNQP